MSPDVNFFPSQSSLRNKLAKTALLFCFVQLSRLARWPQVRHFSQCEANKCVRQTGNAMLDNNVGVHDDPTPFTCAVKLVTSSRVTFVIHALRNIISKNKDRDLEVEAASQLLECKVRRQPPLSHVHYIWSGSSLYPALSLCHCVFKLQAH